MLDTDRAKMIICSVTDSSDLAIMSFHGGAEGKNAFHVTGRNEMFTGEGRGNVREFAHRGVGGRGRSRYRPGTACTGCHGDLSKEAHRL